MKWVKKLFRIKEYDKRRYTNTGIKHFDQLCQELKAKGYGGMTLSYIGPPSVNRIFTTSDDDGVYYAFWDKTGTLHSYKPEGINNSNL